MNKKLLIMSLLGFVGLRLYADSTLKNKTPWTVRASMHKQTSYFGGDKSEDKTIKPNSTGILDATWPKRVHIKAIKLNGETEKILVENNNLVFTKPEKHSYELTWKYTKNGHKLILTQTGNKNPKEHTIERSKEELVKDYEIALENLDKYWEK